MICSARDVMTRSVVAITADTHVDEACSLMLRHNVSGLPVIDDDGRLIGVLSEHDVLRLLYDLETELDRVSHYATHEVVTANADDSILIVFELFMRHPFRRIPIVDNDGKLVGIVSRRDLIRFIRDMRMKIAGVLEKRRQPETV